MTSRAAGSPTGSSRRAGVKSTVHHGIAGVRFSEQVLRYESKSIREAPVRQLQGDPTQGSGTCAVQQRPAQATSGLVKTRTGSSAGGFWF